MEDDVDSVCLVRTISRQIRETAKDPILSQVMRFVKEGWPHALSEELKDFKKVGKFVVNREWLPFLRHTGNNSFNPT